jgi:hypothetical protein
MCIVEEERPAEHQPPETTDEWPVDEELHVADELEVSLGPLFTLGAVLLIYGLLRRRPVFMAGGIAAVWLDQRSELGRSLKARVRGTVEEQIKGRALG